MTIVRIGSDKNDYPMEFEFPDFMSGCIFMGLVKDHYREDDLLVDLVEEGDVE